MGLQKLLFPVLGVAFLAGSFAAGFFYFRSPPKPDGVRTVTELPEPDVHEQNDDDENKPEPKPSTGRERPARSPSKNSKSASAPAGAKSKKSLTRAEAIKLGDDCIGERVTWTGERAITQSARIDGKDGTEYIIKGQLPSGEYSFQIAFIAQEPVPHERKVLRMRTQEEMRRDLEKFRKFKESTGLKGADAVKEYAKLKADTVTVTGTISRLTTLFLIGEGTYHNVPVLTDVTIVHTNPNREKYSSSRTTTGD